MTADKYFFDDRADNTFELLQFSKNDRLGLPTHHKIRLPDLDHESEQHLTDSTS
jgi:hypothetical protein